MRLFPGAWLTYLWSLTFKRSDSPSFKNYKMFFFFNSSSAKSGTHCPCHNLYEGFCLYWLFVGLLHAVTNIISSYIWLHCCISRWVDVSLRSFHPLPHLSWRFLNPGERMCYSCSIYRWALRILFVFTFRLCGSLYSLPSSKRWSFSDDGKNLFSIPRWFLWQLIAIK